MTSIVLHAREAGVASMLAPLIEPMQRAGFSIFYDVEDDAAAILKNEPKADFKNMQIALCGFDDAQKDRTGEFLNKIEKYKMLKIGILDTWKGADRFWKLNGKLRTMTDYLFVPDNALRSYLNNKGISKDKIFVVGHPGIEKMFTWSETERKKMKSEGLKTLGLNENQKIVTFLSEPISEKKSLLNLTTRNGVLVSDFVQKKYGMDCKILLRLHPIEKAECPQSWTDTKKLSFEVTLAVSDLVVGLTSTALAYAAAASISVDCIDQELQDWKPEDSKIPTTLWKHLLEEGIFKKVNIMHQSSTQTIIKKINELQAKEKK